MSNKREYMRVYMAERYERRLSDARKHLGGVCARCGTTHNLEFDHIDPSTKLFTIGTKAAGIAHDKFWSEVDKCQLLCYTCHKLKHRAPHGTLARYRDCKCEECRGCKRDYNRKMRKVAVEV